MAWWVLPLLTNSALSTRPLDRGSPSVSRVSYTTEKRSPLRSERRKSICRNQNSSATCARATESAMFDASVAANSELWMMPPRQTAVGCQLGGFDAGRKLVVARALDDQAAEVAAVVRHPARRQADQAVVVGGFCRHDAAAAAQHAGALACRCA